MDAGFALQVLAVALGGGTVQLIIAMVRRRAEIRELDAKADATALDASNRLIERLELEAERQSRNIATLVADHQREMEEMTSRLTAAAEENARLQREVALLRTEVNIARRQIEQLGGGDTGVRRYPDSGTHWTGR